MENEFSLKDFDILLDYINLILTSVDVGCRKPIKEGFLKIVEHFTLFPNEMINVGNEKKDIAVTNSIGAVLVLINSDDTVKKFSQK